ncbi:MAG: alpha-L-glutamate ligase-like protein [Methylophagaceae bacterium]|jgi:alpha-L-glutamate ligase-like protein
MTINTETIWASLLKQKDKYYQTLNNFDAKLPWRRLERLGVLGMNKRNGDFIAQYNPRAQYPLVDDKLKTKRLAEQAGLAVPTLYGVVKIEKDIPDLVKHLDAYGDFVIKPAHGSGGEGILIIISATQQGYRKSSGQIVSEQDIFHHISNILSGMYSLGGLPDTALIEQRVQFDPVFSDISYQGVPDIRTIVFKGIPVMSMLRLPTHESEGKANLHQGAIGVGIDLKTGKTLNGVMHEHSISHHPDTGHAINDVQIPGWNLILELTAQCDDLVGMGYIGVDIILDRKHGPLMLEMNARPGLSIQIANQCGLLIRLNKIEAMPILPKSVLERIALAKTL